MEREKKQRRTQDSSIGLPRKEDMFCRARLRRAARSALNGRSRAAWLGIFLLGSSWLQLALLCSTWMSKIRVETRLCPVFQDCSTIRCFTRGSSQTHPLCNEERDLVQRGERLGVGGHERKPAGKKKKRGRDFSHLAFCASPFRRPYFFILFWICSLLCSLRSAVLPWPPQHS